MQSPAGESERETPPPRVLQGLAALVLAAATIAGLRAFDRDLTRAFRDESTGVFPPSMLGQFQILHDRLPAGSNVLLIAGSKTDEIWNARLLQRGLYPRNVVVVIHTPMPDDASMAKLRDQFGLRYAISLGTPPADPEFLRREDLGALPGTVERAWFGELAR